MDMKKSNFHLFFFFSFFTFLIFSCVEQSPHQKEDDVAPIDNANIENRFSGVTYTIEDDLFNFVLTITFYADGSNSLTATEKAEVGTYLLKRFSNKNFSTVTNVSTLFGFNENDVNKEKVTLTGFGKNREGEMIPIAFVFHGNGDGLGGAIEFSGNDTGKIHSCTGSPCTCCEFLYKHWTTTTLFGDKITHSEIIGCKCVTTPEACFVVNGQCNHTITSPN